MDINQIFKNNETWINDRKLVDPEYFTNLAKGQNPEILYIGCSDSRVAAEEMMGVGPGEIFVHRNIGNMVPNTDLNVMSVINYAVTHLKVKHVVVCGHYYCGGVKAAMQSKDLGILNPWLRNIRDVYRIYYEHLQSIPDEEDRYKRLVELNVREQCVNVIKAADVQIAYKKRNLAVHGWVFDIHSGKILDLNIDYEEVMEGIMEIYHLQPSHVKV